MNTLPPEMRYDLSSYECCLWPLFSQNEPLFLRGKVEFWSESFDMFNCASSAQWFLFELDIEEHLVLNFVSSKNFSYLGFSALSTMYLVLDSIGLRVK